MMHFSFTDILKFADQHGGRVITKEITFLKKCQAIHFECGKGHRWEVVTHKALIAPWCPECSGSTVQKNTIALMRKIAKDRGGKCLSEEYINSETKLEWECCKGHRWFSTPHSVKTKKAWCKTCKNESQKNTIEDMQKLAAKKGGRCISEEYVLNNVNLRWECSEGHQWENQPANITMGQWCPVCSKNEEKLTIEEMKELAVSRGGECLSVIYVNGKKDLKWRCSEGHEWEAPAIRVKHNKAWCPYCAGNVKKTFDEMKNIAASFGGSLLSKEYLGTKEKHKWECSKGHIFFKTPNHIIHRGQWCPQCSRLS